MFPLVSSLTFSTIANLLDCSHTLPCHHHQYLWFPTSVLFKPGCSQICSPWKSSSWEIIKNANSQPTPDLLNQKPWRCRVQHCVLTRLPGNSDARSSLKTKIPANALSPTLLRRYFKPSFSSYPLIL